ncbi:DUF4142 domain-containing protein [Pirellulaceae bacterium SH501]
MDSPLVKTLITVTKIRLFIMKHQFTIATLAALIAASSLSAQQVLPGQPQSKVTPSDQNATLDSRLSKEQILAKCLSITNQEQVAIASYAKENATHEEVKALATTLEKAHQECLNELTAIATKAAAGKRSATPISTIANNHSNGVDFLQLHQEMSDQCLKDSKEMLGKKEGAEFDTCFVGLEIAKHGMMHSSLTVLQRHTTGELQSFIKASLVKNDEHMKAATDLMERLAESPVTRTAKIPK